MITLTSRVLKQILPLAQYCVCQYSVSLASHQDMVQLRHRSAAAESRPSQAGEPNSLPTVPDLERSQIPSVCQHRRTAEKQFNTVLW